MPHDALRAAGVGLAAALLLGACGRRTATPVAEAPRDDAAEATSQEPADGERAGVAEAGGTSGQAAVDWTASSPDQASVVKQYRLGPEHCRLQGESRGQLEWASETCLATHGELVFVEDGGERILVLDPFPEFEEGALLRARLGAAYRQAELQRPIKAAEVLRDPEKLHRTVRHYYWLRGVLGESGPAPRLVPGGLQVSTLDGLVRTIAFDGTLVSDPPAAAAALEAPAATSTRSWVAQLERKEESQAGDWSRRFRAASAQVAAAEKEVSAIKARIEAIEKNGVGIPAGPSGWRSNTPGESWQGSLEGAVAARGAAWGAIQNEQRALADAERRLARAREEYEELERKARFEGVPFEWRK